IADPIAASGDSADFNFQSTSGGFYSNEAYAELSVPILSNMPAVEALEASVAGRYVNYNTFGGKFTYQFGARYTPVRDLTMASAIGVTGTADILNGCYAGGVDEYCSLIIRNNSGAIQYVNDFFANIGTIKTSGVDFAIRYALPTEVGRFAFGFDGTWLAKYDITLKLKSGDLNIQGKDTYDAGSYGALPQFKATSGLDWSLGGFIAGLTGRFVS